MGDKVILKIKQGEALPVVMTIKSGGNPFDLSDCSLTVQVKDAPYIDIPALFTKEITTTSDLNTVGQITDPTSGKFQIMFTQEDTSYPVNEYALIITLNNGISKDIISSKCCGSGQYIICPQ